ncbi:MAG: PmoA family protein [Gemmataceae bacterium]
MPFQVPGVQVVPQPDDQVSLQVEGVEKLRWHASSRYPRPFFFPLIGPSGRSLTRMGHPAAPNHDHHRSLWWGHRDVGGVNFWEERGGAQHIRQEAWVHYQDGADEAGMVVNLGWFDAHKSKLLHQQLIAVYRPLANGESWLEVQTTFTPTVEQLPLGQTNFGFLGLRVAASLSAHYGGGRLRGSEGQVGEPDNFAQSARWMDYSGPISGTDWEGITWFDHPTNPRHPTPWHVRDDGWMSPAFCLREGYVFQGKQPLTLRYGWHGHRGEVDAKIAVSHQRAFALTPAWEVAAVARPWQVTLRRRKT